MKKMLTTPLPVDGLKDSGALLISTPIQFTSDYSSSSSLRHLEIIKNVGAFSGGRPETIPELKAFGERIKEVPGKRGLNAFSNTELDKVLAANGVTHVVLRVVTSICIDSTGRAARARLPSPYLGLHSWTNHLRAELYCENTSRCTRT